ncbi:hypothetical protein P171DRAFT_34885 [Karstenula rhodostoma CBS 690.94]|uniref:Uncharacterized protein n=1 Tax=Karstenula rhodostoma CBS 690.94 TaxID=1392251 RepID=A0A9P4PGD5_9PLEO|nr:hypothetical protein P171DRAFT_34885 [Karstenula rhodostoma CBS 690.94]
MLKVKVGHGRCAEGYVTPILGLPLAAQPAAKCATWCQASDGGGGAHVTTAEQKMPLLSLNAEMEGAPRLNRSIEIVEMHWVVSENI